MEIRFTTKEESNKLRQEEFLSLSGGERILSFLRLCEQIATMFPPKKAIKKNNGNFMIDFTKKWSGTKK